MAHCFAEESVLPVPLEGCSALCRWHDVEPSRPSTPEEAIAYSLKWLEGELQYAARAGIGTDGFIKRACERIGEATSFRTAGLPYVCGCLVCRMAMDRLGSTGRRRVGNGH